MIGQNNKSDRCDVLFKVDMLQERRYNEFHIQIVHGNFSREEYMMYIFWYTCNVL